jgi:hypothetical protein
MEILRMRKLSLSLILLLQTACATTGATLGSGVGDRQLEHPPYVAGQTTPIAPEMIARVPIQFQRGASQPEMFDPPSGPGTQVAALLEEMNAFADSLLGARVLTGLAGGGLVQPNVYFGCDRGGSDECPERGDSVLGRRFTTMRLAVERPSRSWIDRNAAMLDSAGASHTLVITLEVGQYWPRQRGITGAKSVELGTDHVVSLPWLTSLETPVAVLQVTGALINREGKAVRIGAEGIMAQRTPLVASGLGAQRVLSDADIGYARIARVSNATQPLAWRHALCSLVTQLRSASCR